jgi:hypothetical protein
LNVFSIAFDGIDDDLVEVVNGIPNIEVIVILSHYYLAFGNPFGVSKIGQQGSLGQVARLHR